MSDFQFAPGFRAAGGRCGLKASGKPDLALIVADGPCTAAGVFTTNQIKAAPVLYDQAVLAANAAGVRAIIANSGCANACTGPQGEQAASTMAQSAAAALGCDPGAVLVLSTGVIGVQLDTAKIAAGVQSLAPALAVAGAPSVAQAIMTTDTRPKTASTTLTINGRTITLAGVAKGAGMIHPMMATMLAIITTDAQIAPELLQSALHHATAATFNCVTVDGDPSTNDTVLLLASGAADVTIDSASYDAFCTALTDLSRDLARQIAADGEGATKLVEVTVSGAHSVSDARTIARAIARSPLVKTAIHGGDPNWGRILAAAGIAGVPFEPQLLKLWLGSVQVVASGTPCAFAEADAAAQMAGPEVAIRLDLGLADAVGQAWTCDLSAEYVSINADYRT